MYVERKSVKGPRIGAAILDYVIIYFISLLIQGGITAFMYFSSRSGGEFLESSSALMRMSMISTGAAIVLQFLYHTLIPFLTKGKTLGKMILGIRVISADYQEASFFQFLLRNVFFMEAIVEGIMSIALFRNLESLSMSNIIGTLIVGVINFVINLTILIMILATNEERGLHDLIAKTIVVEKDFSLDKLNQASILEMNDMSWAEFDEVTDEKGNKIILNDGNEDDTITLLKDDEIELFKEKDDENSK